MNRSIHHEAEQDITDALRFYKREAGKGVARRFLAEFERVVDVLERFPDLGKPTSDGTRRVYPVTGFPYSIIYRQLPHELRILVLRHQSRDPGYGEARS